MDIPGLEGFAIETGFTPVELLKSRVILVGRVLTGKSTFLASWPETLILDFDKGAGNIPKAKAHRAKLRTYEEAERLFDKLKTLALKKQHPYKMLAFDGMDQWVELVASYLDAKFRTEKKNFDSIWNYGVGLGYIEIARHALAPLKFLNQLGYGWTAVCHSKMVYSKEDSGGSPVQYERYSLPDSVMQWLKNEKDYAWATDIQVERENVVKPGGKGYDTKVSTRVVLTTENLSTGDREYAMELGGKIWLPTTIELGLQGGYDAVMTEWNRSVELLRDGENPREGR